MEIKRDILSLGELIIEMRKEKGYSQRKFAQISGLSNTTISRIENGETLHPDIETIRLLAAHLDIDETHLVKLVNSTGKQIQTRSSAKLNYIKQPIRKIQRYSSVFSAAHHSPEPKLETVEISKAENIIESKIEERIEEKLLSKVNLKGMRLITLRLEKNITQKELADALGIDKTLISQYEGEIIKPDFDTAEKLAQYFDVSLEYLCGNVEKAVEVSIPIKEYIKEETAVSDNKKIDLKPEYLSIAKEIQAANIDPEDIRAFINIIIKNRAK